MPFTGGHMLWIILLLGVALIVFGPKRLPEIGSGFGRAIREFKVGVSEVHNATSQPPSGPSAQVLPAATVASDVRPAPTASPSPAVETLPSGGARPTV